ncbi:hypothetical protein AB0B63_07235 [Micromonospora sp. NPDC049081]|uniref:hypothetical protein n=1 Tax=Micromonospora sp. NPDC049081 TaxID=3155150 RepID=UPI0033CAA988
MGRPDPKLAAALAADDKAEDQGMHGDDRRTCHTHQTWVDNCKDSPLHRDPHLYALAPSLFDR